MEGIQVIHKAKDILMVNLLNLDVLNFKVIIKDRDLYEHNLLHFDDKQLMLMLP